VLAIRQDGRDAVFLVRLQPKASREEIVGVAADGVLRLRVTAPPVGGHANEACLRLLARILGLPVSRLRVAAGHRARLKTIRVTDTRSSVISATLSARLNALRRTQPSLQG
jgi:hypothetical protein